MWGRDYNSSSYTQYITLEMDSYTYIDSGSVCATDIMITSLYHVEIMLEHRNDFLFFLNSGLYM